MIRYFLIITIALFFGACSDSNDQMNTISRQEINDQYKLGMGLLNKGDSCMAYWHWSIVKNQWDKSFEDTITKYQLKKCTFSQ